jgi:hypothetical protein
VVACLGGQELADALNGATPSSGVVCNVTVGLSPPLPELARGAHAGADALAPLPPALADPAAAGASYYADPVKGSDGNPGTLSAPFLTISKVRVRRPVGSMIRDLAGRWLVGGSIFCCCVVWGQPTWPPTPPPLSPARLPPQPLTQAHLWLFER